MSRAGSNKFMPVRRQGLITSLPIPTSPRHSQPGRSQDLGAIQTGLGKIAGVANQLAGLSAFQTKVLERGVEEQKEDLRDIARIDINAGRQAAFAVKGTILSQIHQGDLDAQIPATGDAGEITSQIVAGHGNTDASPEYQHAFFTSLTGAVTSQVLARQANIRTRHDAASRDNALYAKWETPEDLLSNYADMDGRLLNKYTPEEKAAHKRNFAAELAMREADEYGPDASKRVGMIADWVGPGGDAVVRGARRRLKTLRSAEFTEFKRIFDDKFVGWFESIQGSVTPEEISKTRDMLGSPLLEFPGGEAYVHKKFTVELPRLMNDLLEQSAALEIDRNRSETLDRSYSRDKKTLASPIGLHAEHIKVPEYWDGKKWKKVFDSKEEYIEYISNRFNRELNADRFSKLDDLTGGMQSAAGGGPGDIANNPPGSPGRMAAEFVQIQADKDFLVGSADHSRDELDLMPNQAVRELAKENRLVFELSFYKNGGFVPRKWTAAGNVFKNLISHEGFSPEDLTRDQGGGITAMRLYRELLELDKYGLMDEAIRDPRVAMLIRTVNSISGTGMTGTAPERLLADASTWQDRYKPGENQSNDQRRDAHRYLKGLGYNPGETADAIDEFLEMVSMRMAISKQSYDLSLKYVKEEGVFEKNYIKVGHRDNPKPLYVGAMGLGMNPKRVRELGEFLNSWHFLHNPDDEIDLPVNKNGDPDFTEATLHSEGSSDGMPNVFTLAVDGVSLDNSLQITREQLIAITNAMILLDHPETLVQSHLDQQEEAREKIGDLNGRRETLKHSIRSRQELEGVTGFTEVMRAPGAPAPDRFTREIEQIDLELGKLRELVAAPPPGTESPLSNIFAGQVDESQKDLVSLIVHISEEYKKHEVHGREAAHLAPTVFNQLIGDVIQREFQMGIQAPPPIPEAAIHKVRSILNLPPRDTR